MNALHYQYTGGIITSVMIMPDSRLRKGLERNRVLLYVSDENKLVLEELLRRLPVERARSLSAAVFEAIKAYIRHWDEEEAGLLPPGGTIDMEKLLIELVRTLTTVRDTDTEVAELIKPVLLAQALLGLETSYMTFSLLGERKHFPWPTVKKGIQELLDEARELSVQLRYHQLSTLMSAASAGSWKRILRQIARSPETLEDPLATVKEMEQALNWVKERLQGGGKGKKRRKVN